MNLKIKLNRSLKTRLLISIQSGELDLVTYPEITSVLNPKTEPFLEMMKEACQEDEKGSSPANG